MTKPKVVRGLITCKIFEIEVVEAVREDVTIVATQRIEVRHHAQHPKFRLVFELGDHDIVVRRFSMPISRDMEQFVGKGIYAKTREVEEMSASRTIGCFSYVADAIALGRQTILKTAQ